MLCWPGLREAELEQLIPAAVLCLISFSLTLCSAFTFLARPPRPRGPAGSAQVTASLFPAPGADILPGAPAAALCFLLGVGYLYHIQVPKDPGGS